MKYGFKTYKTLKAIIISISASLAINGCKDIKTSEIQKTDVTQSKSAPSLQLFKEADGSRLYLSDPEKAFLSQGRKLPKLSIEDKEDLKRRLSFEINRAIESQNYEKATSYAKLKLEISTAISLETPNSYPNKLQLILSSNTFGDIERAKGNPDKARDIYLKCIETLNTIPPPPHFKSFWLQLITSLYKDIGDLEAELKNYDAAEEAYKKYLKHVVKNPSNEDYFSHQADGHSNLAELSFQQENWAEAVKHYGQSVKLRQKLIDQRKVQSNLRDELNLWKSQANAHTRSGYSSYLLSNDREAEASFAKAITARQSSIKAHLAGPAEELDLAVAYYNAAKYTDGKDDVYFQSASEIFDRLEKKMTIPTRYEDIRTDFRVLIKP